MSPLNWTNRTLWTGNNLNIMRGMISESVDHPIRGGIVYAVVYTRRVLRERGLAHRSFPYLRD